MSDNKVYPRIAEVVAKPGKRLLVRFRNGVSKLYDCKRILRNPAFEPLRDDVLFRHARADKHGYGVIWNDELDLAESEVWIRGKVVREPRAVYETSVSPEPTKSISRGGAEARSLAKTKRTK